MAARVPAEERVFALLRADAAVAAAVGDRIYPCVAPQGATFPRLVYGRVSSTRETTQAGESGIERVRLQVNCEGSTYAEAKAAAAAVLDAMDAATSFASDPVGQADGREEEMDIYTVALDFEVLNDER